MNVHSNAPLTTRDILGVHVASVTREEAVAHLLALIAARKFTRVGFLNAHNANVACADPEFRRVLQTFLVLADGVGVDVAAKLLYGKPFPENLNGTDFIPAFLSASPKRLTVGLLGASRPNVERAASALRRLAPLHTVEVISHGFFEPSDESAILEAIRKLRPDVLLVAMGVPRQEFWIARNLEGQHCTLPIAVGALFDFLAGAVPRAPTAIRKLRLEWLFRLIVEPGRLWRRYIVGNPLFMVRVFRQKFLGNAS